MNEVAFLSKMNKRMSSVQYVSNFESIFKCPVCASSMKIFESTSLICLNGHTFDFTKQGYINLITHSVKNKYSKELFEARRKLITHECFFEPLSHTIAKKINTFVL